MAVAGRSQAGAERARPLVPCPVVVGRASEEEALAEALAEGLRGHGSLVFVIGEAGIGKSRLVQELVSVAAERGARVLRGRAVPGSAGTAFRPLAEAFLPVMDELGDEQGEFAVWSRVLAAIFPTTPGCTSAEVAGPVAGEAVIQALRKISGARGAVLVLEDLHWADPETVAMVEYLGDQLHRAPTLCLVTVRSEESSPARDLVRRVEARRSSSVLELDRLNDAQVAAMVHECSAGDGLERVTSLGEGIPFLIEELLVSPGVPVSLAETVQARLESLSELERRVLRTAAAFGRHFDWRLLPSATGQDADEVVDALDRGVEVQLLSIEGEGFRFRHALSADAVFTSVSPPRRVRLAAAALEALDGLDADVAGWRESAARLAERAGYPDRAGRLHLELGDDAFRRGALHTAVAALERAAELLTDRVALLRAHERLVDALAHAGRVDDALTVGRDLLNELPDERAAAVRLRLAWAATTAARWDVATEQLRGLADIVEEDAPAAIRAELALRESELAMATHDLERADHRARDAAEIAVGAGLIEAECAALQLLGRIARRSSLDTAASWFRQALEVAERHDLTIWRQRALYEMGTIALLDRSEVDDLLAAQRLAEDLGAMATATMLDIEIAAGYAGAHDLDAQVRHAESAVRRGTELGLDFVVAFAWHFIAAAAVFRGDRERAAAAAEASRAVLSDSRDIAGLLVGCDLVGALLGEDRDAARALAAECTAQLRGSDTAPPMHLRGAWALMLAVDHDPSAGAAVEELEAAGVAVSRAGRGGLTMARAIIVGWTDTAAAMEQAREADELLQSVPFWRHVVRRLAAEAAANDGWMLPEGWLAESEDWFRGQGYHRLAAACRQLAGSAPRTIPVAWAALGITPREADVLGLVIEGLANKEVAESLHLSVRTVEKHVESLLRKTGTTSRTQLARVAGRTT